jgi:2,4-dienoyl-CoA reductase-like NADH-dependent reductase (Old Yellow Enzyme family)
MSPLLQPLRLGTLTLPNRIGFGAHLTNFGRGNRFTARHVAYYAERAAGGVGLLVTEALTVHPLDWPYEHAPFGHGDAIVPSLRRVVEAVRAANPASVVLAQLNHTGGQCSGRLLRQSPWAPSPMVDPASKRMAREMLPEEIAQVQEGFAAAARRCALAGLAGVELNAGQWSLLRQFLSPLTNQRQDAYGGPLEHRLRMVQETVRAVRAALPAGAVLGMKLCGDELAPWGGLTPADSAEIARRLVAAGGLDYLSIEIGGPYSTHMTDAAMPTPQGHAAHLAEAVRKAVDGAVPVFADGRIESPAVAEGILAKGQADAVLMTRALISDPRLPRKVAGEEPGPLRPHIGNTRYFAVRGDWNRPLGDLANPRAGREAILPPVRPAEAQRRVLVVGAGPAGLEAAVTLAQQGHAVTLAEREAAIGGWARVLAERVPARAEYRRLVDYYAAMLRRLGVAVQLKRAIRGDEKALADFDTIYLATGAAAPPAPLARQAPVPVLSARELLADGAERLPAPGGKRALVLDSEGGFRMGNAVEFLLAAGYGVDVVSADFFVGRALVESQDFLWFSRVAARPDGSGALFHPRTEPLRWQGEHLVCADRFSRQERTLGPAGLAVIATLEVPDADLPNALAHHHPHVVTLGDARAPRLMGEAILHAHRTVTAARWEGVGG